MDYQGKNVLVLGLARSGAAVARLLNKHGARVVANDQKERESFGDVPDELGKLGIEVICGGHPEGIVSPNLDLLVKNPGIPYTAAPIQQALALGIPIVTEVEVAYQFAKAPIIGITGSNGKTTTTTLTGEILKAAGLNPVVAGNIGTALSEIVEEVRADQWLVAELSSFQLLGTDTFRPRIGALLNLYKAHLDYHGTMEEYIAAKSRLFRNQAENDVAVLNADQPAVMELANSLQGRIFPFSIRKRLEEGVFVKDESIIVRSSGQDVPVCRLNDIPIKGAHNLENVLAATAIAYSAGASPGSIREGIRGFKGVEHRLEFVAEKNGVTYYNDSKATNAEAATRAITSFSNPVVLIAGGLDRGTDFAELIPVFQKHVKAIVTLGQSADKLAAAAEKAGVLTRFKAGSIEEAVSIAANAAETGDSVLLSPACASWDMYSSFEERGRIFKDAVHTM
ncbi:UDP-N-acetylmuramoyl-L-alanine--D-glutamate ligase [Effusibacillus lacus]|uniref:UDP-N-acetylmuramoylalanine--D-glutamate ligase n=1 Tax=Effusibacillus lacus TaxID=1348429 RepID=A0A292YM47_9BACL|nr:UDP-N-acetylmuramoyl-L-alanine--D-glutamate ligase [Effusibacillus lacus]TCS75687.1 UDP-N-acetylmuramoylalanine--D-glutamate ligase [Effusibacillus lacus]GAX91008.1 UDP-N-acetylmuramoyl-L-alanine--D-glutamate ligase [Effusibacillus lacus]